MSTVSEVMHRGLVTCRPETSLAEAAALLVERRVHALLVADQDGTLAGVLSDTDLLTGEWLAGDAERLATMRTMSAADLMSRELVTIDAGASTEEAAGRLAAEHLGRLVVAERGTPAGVVAVSDLVAVLARAPEERRTVADVMSRAFVVCRPETPASALARAMTDRRSRSVVIVAPDGRPLGIVTGHDLLSLVGGHMDPSAEELMHEPLAIEPGASLQDAADALLRNDVHRLLAIDPADSQAVPLGIISSIDVVSEMAAPGSAWR